MKFSALFTSLLATLAVASPLVPAPEVEVAAEPYDSLRRRADPVVTETKAYLSVKAKFANPQNGEWYKFTSKSPNKPLQDHETAGELRKLQEKLGFKHIGVVVGEIKITETGPKNKKKIKRDFVAKYIDLWKKETGAAEYNENRFEPKKVYDLSQGLKTTKAKASKASDKGKAYFKEVGHDKYNVDTNNCNTFAQDLYEDI